MADYPRRQLAAAHTEAERWQAELAAARAVVEAAQRLVNNAKHDVDPVDVYDLAQALKRYNEQREGGGTPTLE